MPRSSRFALLALAACSDTASSTAPEHLDISREAIINGAPDTTHTAVVTVTGGMSACSGTIIQTNGSTGFALTAAHCGQPQYVIQANDYQSPSAIVYPVTDFLAHPSYNQQVYDFMMVAFTGAGSSTPVIAAMTSAEDNLSPGTQVRHVGYGLSGPAPGTQNSIRRQIVGTLSQLSSLTISYQQPNGGPCQGDSGGPQLTTSGPERVAGVTSFGTQGCAGTGVSGRVSAVYDSFIMAYINNTPIGNMTCNQCYEAATTGVGTCMGAVDACFANATCSALVQCFNACTTQACINACANQHSGGVALYDAISQCVCSSACLAECGDEPFCQSPSTTTGAGPATVGATTGVGAGGAGSGPTGAGAGTEGWIAGNAANVDPEGSVVSSACSVRGRGMAVVSGLGSGLGGARGRSDWAILWLLGPIATASWWRRTRRRRMSRHAAL